MEASPVDLPEVAITAQAPIAPGQPTAAAFVFGEYLPTSQMPAYTGRSKQRWKVDRMNGVGPPYVVLAGRIYYPRRELDAYMAQHLVRPKKAS
jgi:hypothetical protein